MYMRNILQVIVHYNDIRKKFHQGNHRHLTNLLNSLRRSWVFRTSSPVLNNVLYNAFVNLTNIAGLPDRATLQILTWCQHPHQAQVSHLLFSSMARPLWNSIFSCGHWVQEISYVWEITHIYMKHEILENLQRPIKASRHIPVIKNSVMLCWLKNTNAWLNQTPPMDVMAETASSLKWATIAPNCPAGCIAVIKWREKTQMMWNQFSTQLSWWWRWVPYGVQTKGTFKGDEKILSKFVSDN